MPALRTIKPLLKVTLLLCVLLAVYQTLIKPRFNTLNSIGEGGTDSGATRPGIRWSREGRIQPGGVVEERKLRQGGAAGAEERNIPPPRPPPRRQPERNEEKDLGQDRERTEKRPVRKGGDGFERQEKSNKKLENDVEIAEGFKRKQDTKKNVEQKKGQVEATFDKELKAMEVRKGLKKVIKGGRDDAEETARRIVPDDVEMIEDGEQEDGERDGPDEKKQKLPKPFHLVEEEDDELDAAQKGDRGGALPGQRKKGPLIQVGGAGNAQGGERQIEKAVVQAQAAAQGQGAADAGQRKVKDKWQGKGWDQRFKKQGEKDKEENEKELNDVEKDAPLTESTDPNDMSQEEGDSNPANPDKLLVQHRLVARFVQRDISHSGSPSEDPSQVTFVAPADEDSFQANAPVRKPKTPQEVPLERHNLTVCALIPNEQRFLPEWLLYHSLLGVSRFALYDTTLPGAFGAGEIDSLADKMQDEAGSGENAPTVDELKAQVTYANAGREGLDEKGLIHRERVRGLEDWIDKDRVKMHYMKFKNPRASHDVHALMLEHCLDKFGSSSNWLAHLDVDEFLSLSTPLYGTDEPYPLDSSLSFSSSSPETVVPDHIYPLHELLDSPALESASCVPVPELSYRNLGIRELKSGQGVLETQIHRDVLGEVVESKSHDGSLPQKTLIHTAFSPEPLVSFTGPHSCEVYQRRDGTDEANSIRDSQGNSLDIVDGIYRAQNLPIEPLAIAHYVQRDLADCHSKLSSVSDPLSLLPKGRGSVSCESHYLPSSSELSSSTWRSDPANKDLSTVPPLGSVLEDTRMKRSWAARAAKVVGDAWRKNQEDGGMKKTSKTDREKLVSRVRHKVEVLHF